MKQKNNRATVCFSHDCKKVMTLNLQHGTLRMPTTLPPVGNCTCKQHSNSGEICRAHCQALIPSRYDTSARQKRTDGLAYFGFREVHNGYNIHWSGAMNSGPLVLKLLNLCGCPSHVRVNSASAKMEQIEVFTMLSQDEEKSLVEFIEICFRLPNSPHTVTDTGRSTEKYKHIHHNFKFNTTTLVHGISPQINVELCLYHIDKDPIPPEHVKTKAELVFSTAHGCSFSAIDEKIITNRARNFIVELRDAISADPSNARPYFKQTGYHIPLLNGRGKQLDKYMEQSFYFARDMTIQAGKTPNSGSVKLKWLSLAASLVTCNSVGGDVISRHVVKYSNILQKVRYGRYGLSQHSSVINSSLTVSETPASVTGNAIAAMGMTIDGKTLRNERPCAEDIGMSLKTPAFAGCVVNVAFPVGLVCILTEEALTIAC